MFKSLELHYLFKDFRNDIKMYFFAKRKHVYDIFRTTPTKIKLVAIAKNEAAYLPEWIAHHLYFGFDHIDVNVNRTSDNTFAIVNNFSLHPQVSIKRVDNFFNTHQANPQSLLYKQAIKEAKVEGFSHVCFLDIDEFWVPRDLKSNIHQCVESISKCDVISFEWANKIEPDNLFGPALDESIIVERYEQIKSVIDTATPIFRLNPHNVVNRFLRFRDANGNRFQHGNKALSRTTKAELKKELKPYFILHRFYRSEVEYIALLGRGRPSSSSQRVGQGKENLKNNRKGYSVKPDVKNEFETITFNSNALREYRQFVNHLLADMLTCEAVDESQQFVLSAYEKVLNIIKQNDVSEKKVIVRSLRNITDKKALEALNIFLAKTS